MLRLLRPCLLTVLLTGCARATHRNYETFAGGCPPGWQYLYTDHDLERTLIHTADVCRKQPDSTTKKAPTEKGPRS